MGVLRAGHKVFLISARNVPLAVVDMLRKTGCRDILVSPDAPARDLAQTAAQDLEGVTIHPMLDFNDLVPSDVESADDNADDLPKEYNMEDVAVMMHSSGTPTKSN